MQSDNIISTLFCATRFVITGNKNFCFSIRFLRELSSINTNKRHPVSERQKAFLANNLLVHIHTCAALERETI
jgi:hypothetical protein